MLAQLRIDPDLHTGPTDVVPRAHGGAPARLVVGPRTVELYPHRRVRRVQPRRRSRGAAVTIQAQHHPRQGLVDRRARPPAVDECARRGEIEPAEPVGQGHVPRTVRRPRAGRPGPAVVQHGARHCEDGHAAVVPDDAVEEVGHRAAIGQQIDVELARKRPAVDDVVAIGQDRNPGPRADAAHRPDDYPAAAGEVDACRVAADHPAVDRHRLPAVAAGVQRGRVIHRPVLPDPSYRNAECVRSPNVDVSAGHDRYGPRLLRAPMHSPDAVGAGARRGDAVPIPRDDIDGAVVFEAADLFVAGLDAVGSPTPRLDTAASHVDDDVANASMQSKDAGSEGVSSRIRHRALRGDHDVLGLDDDVAAPGTGDVVVNLGAAVEGKDAASRVAVRRDPDIPQVDHDVAVVVIPRPDAVAERPVGLDLGATGYPDDDVAPACIPAEGAVRSDTVGNVAPGRDAAARHVDDDIAATPPVDGKDAVGLRASAGDRQVGDRRAVCCICACAVASPNPAPVARASMPRTTRAIRRDASPRATPSRRRRPAVSGNPRPRPDTAMRGGTKSRGCIRSTSVSTESPPLSRRCALDVRAVPRCHRRIDHLDLPWHLSPTSEGAPCSERSGPPQLPFESGSLRSVAAEVPATAFPVASASALRPPVASNARMARARLSSRCGSNLFPGTKPCGNFRYFISVYKAFYAPQDAADIRNSRAWTI